MTRSGGGPSGDGVALGAPQVTRWRSIRYRLLLPIAVATLGLFTLGFIQGETAASEAKDARRAQTLSHTATATVRLEHQIEQEIAETDAVAQRGGSGAQLLIAQQARTDAAVAEYRAAARQAAEAAPALRSLLNAADTEIGKLGAARGLMSKPAAAGSQPAENAYAAVTGALLAVAESLPQQISDQRLAGTARAVALLASAEHTASVERELLRDVFHRGRFTPGEQTRLAELRGAEQERLTQFDRVASTPVRQRYAELMTGADITTARDMIDAALQVDPDESSPALRVDPDAWYIAQSDVLRRLHLVELDVSTMLDDDARQTQNAADVHASITGSLTTIAVAVGFLGAVMLAVRISRRLRSLRRAALAVATTELPTAISSVTSAPSPSTVREVMHESAGRADAILGTEPDEIGEVALALAALHRQALRLAADQALLRMDIAAVFVALSRRGQTLIQRQLQLIDEFERAEDDPNVLSRLFALDHLAARMRRNEENLLVLAGGEPGRRFTSPVPLVDVIRAAAAEIEYFSRVDAMQIVELDVQAHAVGDLIHLLAELLENATVFSPPSSRVRVAARRAVGDVEISIYDEGIGMPPEHLAEINKRLAEPSTLTSDLVRTMGLLVVGRLAARHDISVELRSSLGGGTVALVRVPGVLLTATRPDANRRLGYSGPLVPAPALSAPATRTVIDAEPVEQPPVPAFGASAHLAPVRPGTYVSPSAARTGTVTTHDSEPMTQTATVTPAGLPRRRPGGQLSHRRVPVEQGSDALLDPDVVRARLAGLAGGLAAGQRRPQPPEPRQ
ncbi:MAG TPA: nitrate- and nitrite sensing domain-containing protein [Micromonosporaceae bacterium]